MALAFLGAQFRLGAEFLAHLGRLEEKAWQVDWAVTGSSQLTADSAHQAVGQVAQVAQRAGIPAVALTLQLGPGHLGLYDAGIVGQSYDGCGIWRVNHCLGITSRDRPIYRRGAGTIRIAVWLCAGISCCIAGRRRARSFYDSRGGKVMRVLVTGGAGYIGSHLVAYLAQKGDEVTVVDNLRQGHAQALALFPSVIVVMEDVSNLDAMTKLLTTRGIEGVYHLAASSLVSESMTNPLAYYQNNVVATTSLLSAMVQAHVPRLVFSSTAAVYGDAGSDPLTEALPLLPTNPYGETKRAIEQMLHWAWRAYGLRSVALRYFNAAGADSRWAIGEDHNPETHLIPTLLKSVGQPQSTSVKIYGTDYPTKDGTAIRDYIHVKDLAHVHDLALQWLIDEDGAFAFNVGSGQGYSVREVVDMVSRVTGTKLDPAPAPRRQGDPPHLVAAVGRIRQELGWTAQYSDLENIVESAWHWHRTHPHGFANVHEAP